MVYLQPSCLEKRRPLTVGGWGLWGLKVPPGGKVCGPAEPPPFLDACLNPNTSFPNWQESRGHVPAGETPGVRVRLDRG